MGNVYRVEEGTGFYIPGITDKLGGKVEAATEYTIRMVLKLDKNSGWNRILNVNPGSDAGFYINDGLDWYSSGRGTPASPTFPANEWHSVTISTGPDQNAAAYFDGGSKAEWLPHGQWSTACRIVTSSLDVMMFFNDGGSVTSCMSGGEHTGLHVKSIQVFNERLTDAQVAQLEVDSPVFPPPPTTSLTGTVALDFTKGILPANMVDISTTACPTRQSVFEADPHMGNVYRVEEGTGFYIPGITDKLGGKVEAATEYTIRMVLKLDKNSGWNRILNVNPGSDAGFYINDGLDWYSSGRGTPASPTFPANEWHSVTISTGPDQNAAAYFDGGSKAEWLPHGQWSTACRIVTSSLDVMMFFNDGGSVTSCMSGGEHTGLHVKSIQVFNERLTDAEVAQLEVDSPVFPAV